MTRLRGRWPGEPAGAYSRGWPLRGHCRSRGPGGLAGDGVRGRNRLRGAHGGSRSSSLRWPAGPLVEEGVGEPHGGLGCHAPAEKVGQLSASWPQGLTQGLGVPSMGSLGLARVPQSCSACHLAHGHRHSYSERTASCVLCCGRHRVKVLTGGQPASGWCGHPKRVDIPQGLPHHQPAPDTRHLPHPSKMPSRPRRGHSSSSSSSGALPHRARRGCAHGRQALCKPGALTSIGCGSQPCGG